MAFLAVLSQVLIDAMGMSECYCRDVIFHVTLNQWNDCNSTNNRAHRAARHKINETRDSLATDIETVTTDPGDVSHGDSS